MGGSISTFVPLFVSALAIDRGVLGQRASAPPDRPSGWRYRRKFLPRDPSRSAQVKHSCLERSFLRGRHADGGRGRRFSRALRRKDGSDDD